MLDWNDEGSDDGHGSDNNDDDDDRPSGDGFDSNKDFYPTPEQDQQGGSFNNYGGDNSGGSGGQSSSSGYFQFQLSQRGGGGTEQHIKPTDDMLLSQQPQALEGQQQEQSSILCSTETPSCETCDTIQCSLQESVHCRRHGSVNSSSSSQLLLPTPKQYVPTTTDNKNAVAGDALTQSLAEEIEALVQTSGLDATLMGNSVSQIVERNAQCEDLLICKNSVGNCGKLQTGPDDDPHLADATQTRSMASSLQGNTAEDVLSARLRDVQSPGILLESKILPSSKKVATQQQLTVSQPLQSIPVTPQSFLSVKFLGTGGFSTVDEVVHRDTNLRLGRKTLKNRDQSALEEIRKEVDVLQKLRHPHVIRFLGACANGDKMSILVSPVADTTLALWLDRFADHKPANLAETVVKMFGCLASSVRYLHEQRPVVKHMDIKPQNILIVGGDQEFPHVVLCDFGISSSDELPNGQAKPVTRQYIAPEVFDGVARKQAADIWSLGCVFAEMASVPFSQDNSGWLSFRKAFNGRTGKHYWQDVPEVQHRLSGFLEDASTTTEQTVVRALKTMLSAEPSVRPNAAALTMIFSPASCCLEWPNDKAIFPGPHEELGAVEMLTREGSVDCCTQLHQGETSESESSLSRAKCWLDDCSHTHDACRMLTPFGTKVLPTRLVDVLPGGQPTSFVRVIDSTSIPSSVDDVDYIALSHAWNQDHVTLKSDWLQEKLTDLPLQTLPTAVNTAISAAQELGHRYIWVDSLCVLQDSEQDKQQECATMATTFRNATMTMVLDQMATDKISTSANQSLQESIPDQQQHPSSLQGYRRHASPTLSTIDFATPGFAWDTRAWALQERLLSRRFLHLGEQMYWECNALKASETFPRGLSPLVWEKVHSKPATDVSNPSTTHRSNVYCSSISTGHQRHRSTASRLRDCQLIKKEGDALGDGMTAATTLKVGSAATAALAAPASYTEPSTHLNSTLVAAKQEAVVVDNVKSRSSQRFRTNIHAVTVQSGHQDANMHGHDGVSANSKSKSASKMNANTSRSSSRNGSKNGHGEII